MAAIIKKEGVNFWEIFIEAYLFYLIYYWADLVSDAFATSPPTSIETRPNNDADAGGKVLPTATEKRIYYGVALIIIFIGIYLLTKKVGW